MKTLQKLYEEIMSSDENAPLDLDDLKEDAGGTNTALSIKFCGAIC